MALLNAWDMPGWSSGASDEDTADADAAGYVWHHTGQWVDKGLNNDDYLRASGSMNSTFEGLRSDYIGDMKPGDPGYQEALDRWKGDRDRAMSTLQSQFGVKPVATRGIGDLAVNRRNRGQRAGLTLDQIFGEYTPTGGPADAVFAGQRNRGSPWGSLWSYDGTALSQAISDYRFANGGSGKYDSARLDALQEFGLWNTGDKERQGIAGGTFNAWDRARRDGTTTDDWKTYVSRRMGHYDAWAADRKAGKTVSPFGSYLEQALTAPPPAPPPAPAPPPPPTVTTQPDYQAGGGLDEAYRTRGLLGNAIRR